ncbi:phosphate acetyltransferase [Lamprocystis purpurea]|jgi:phosphate acetyltransferase|uniref:phosphate acetyltransferase n=1 Tax=Lamprocystis purpurea TaxID=61598 RepID=UPI00037E0367|nr:phosphate acetyltransferase [Lamprocystis purpurea]
MNSSFTQIFLVTPVRQGVGLTSAALGIVRALQRLGVEVGFVKPIAQEPEDNSDHFAREIFQIPVPAALALADSAERIAANQTSQLLEDVVALCMNASTGVGVLVVEGLHTDAEHPFASQLNVDLARSLKAEVVLVADASLPQAVTESRLAASQFANEDCRVAGVIFNKAPKRFDPVLAQNKLGQVRIWGVVPENPILRAPRTLDIAQHLKADLVWRGELDTRRVTEFVTAARSVAEVIPRLRPGVLVITSGDRDDVILACALAASRGIELAGILLTHASAIAPRVMEFAGPALTSGLPILGSDDDSYGTARQVSHIPRTVPKDDIARMNTVLDCVAEHLDAETISAAFHLRENTKLSPPAFRYQLIQKARAAQKRIVLPEGEEPRTLRAAAICEAKGIAHCVLLGKREAIEMVAAAQGITLPAGLEILDPDAIRANYVDAMVTLRKAKGLTPTQALEQLEDVVVVGTMMLAVGDVDGLVSGAVHTTANTVRPAMQLIKTAPGASIVSSVFFMLMPDQVLVYGDCAINPDPTADQLAEIAQQSADSAAAFGITPKVAMISYSTGLSGTGDDVNKVRMATEIAHAKYPDLVLDGPLQYDAASTADVGRQKAPGSPVAGQATVFIFPDLNTGNTTYKAVQRSANVVSVGPMLQGLRKPVNDLSRGALVDDIVFTIALTAIQAQQTP